MSCPWRWLRIGEETCRLISLAGQRLLPLKLPHLNCRSARPLSISMLADVLDAANPHRRWA
ncbi:hypothetical protein BDA96_10G091900 [Sorghum bicolor]|uniref:Uncharacterized protein n=2 Tax=Sorghum bicolor TaxID=4558 RepID=A0A921U061_SORBI|nr:hypothetical protein BDA96_10G091900 [Sorghum bicolor]KXG19549.1 hypothetical protein SORBI_3010G075700 [Sorghum bicolor]